MSATTAVLFAATLASTAAAQPVLTTFGGHPQGDPPQTQYRPADVSYEGFYIAGSALPYPDDNGTPRRHELPWVYSPSLGHLDIGLLTFPGACANWSRVTALNFSNGVAVGISENAYPPDCTTRQPTAFRWSPSTGIQSLGAGKAVGISSDGQIAVGSHDGFPCRWLADGTLQFLGGLGTGTQGEALAADYTGSTIVGWSHTGTADNPGPRRAFIWGSFTGTMSQIGSVSGPGSAESRATHISHDGRVVVGQTNGLAFRWTSGFGNGTQLLGQYGRIPGTLTAVPTGLSSDGKVVVGISSTPGWVEPFLWTQPTGLIYLTQYLSEQDLNFEPLGVSALSPDATVMVGASETGWRISNLSLGCFVIRDQPHPATSCPYHGASFFVMPADISDFTSNPPTYRWQRETEFLSNTWVDLADGPTTTWDGDQPGVGGIIAGAGTHNLQINHDTANGRSLAQVHAIRFRCRVSKNCGTVISRSSPLTVSDCPPPPCGSADFNGDGDSGTDADIEDFFACLAGNCPHDWCFYGADFNQDGDWGTDADIESFFRVLAGGPC